MPPKPRTEPAAQPAAPAVVDVTESKSQVEVETSEPEVEEQPEPRLTELELELEQLVVGIMHGKLYGMSGSSLSDGNQRAVVEHDYDDHGMVVEFRVAPYFQPDPTRYRVDVTLTRLP